MLLQIYISYHDARGVHDARDVHDVHDVRDVRDVYEVRGVHDDHDDDGDHHDDHDDDGDHYDYHDVRACHVNNAIHDEDYLNFHVYDHQDHLDFIPDPLDVNMVCLDD